MPVTDNEYELLNEHIEFHGDDGKKRTLNTDMYFLAQLFKKIKKGYSPTVAICGCQRVGKSFIGVWLCYLMSQLFGKKLDITKCTFYEPMSAIKDLEHKSREPLLIDEASDVLDVREWYKQTHQALKSVINTQAYKTMLYIFISPFTIDIDKAFRKHFDFQLRVDDKGSIKSFRFIKKYDELNEKRVVRRIFLDDVYVNLKNVPKEIWKQYLEYSISEKEKIRQRRSIIEDKKEPKAKPTEHEENIMMMADNHGG